jgi:hypothetical protein
MTSDEEDGRQLAVFESGKDYPILPIDNLFLVPSPAVSDPDPGNCQAI